MAPKAKKQHYVPQFYLNAWSIPEKHQIHVYDKSTNAERINNISDVASERYFYDANVNDLFSQEYLDLLRQEGYELPEENVQLLEQTLSEGIEKPFSDLIKEILEKAKNATPWHIKNCLFLKKNKKKINFSVYLAVQMIRVKTARDNLTDISKCVTQALTDRNTPDSVISNYEISESEAKSMHIQMLMDLPAMAELATSFHRLTWILGINKTTRKFYTSDNPICTIPHIKSPYASMSGVSSKGVEVLFPLSPEVILLMLDGSYHTEALPFERRYIEIRDNQYIDSYNSTIAINAKRCVFSFDGNYELIEGMIKRNPRIFNQGHVQLTWAGKTYLPENK